MTAQSIDQRRKNFRAIAELLDLSTNAWALSADVNEKTLRNFLSGNTKAMREDTALKLSVAAQKVAESRGHNIDALLGGKLDPDIRSVWVHGFVLPGGIISRVSPSGGSLSVRDHPVPALQPDTDDWESGLYEVRTPPGLPDDQAYIAYELRGFPMLPAQDRWILYFLKLGEIEPAKILGQGCIVQLLDGTILFRIVRRGYAADRFNLESWDGTGFVEDVQIVRAYPYVGCCRPDLVKS